MDLSPEKCALVPFTCNRMSGLKFSVIRQDIEPVKFNRLLGVYLDNVLAWNHHITAIEGKVSQLMKATLRYCCLMGCIYFITTLFAQGPS